jgi:ubiquinone/menaquinone biosynthesis C-methylase UbiE
MLDSGNKYTFMQKHTYDVGADRWSLEDRDHVVGSFDAHNAHEDYELLFEGLKTEGKIGLDFGCGPGRNLVKYADRFKRLDGADISGGNLEKATIWCEHNSVKVPNLYQTDGISLSGVPPKTYDMVMSTITLQHIAVYEIRFNILTEMHRVLKKGGWITLQMGYGPDKGDAYDYFANEYELTTTNGNADVKVESPDQLKGDLTKIGFKNFTYEIRPVGPGDNHSNWIFFKAQK